MKLLPLLLTASVIVVFFFMATATSDNDDLTDTFIDAKLNVRLLDTFLILANEGKLDFENASIYIYYDTGDSAISNFNYHLFIAQVLSGIIKSCEMKSIRFLSVTLSLVTASLFR